ncbi:methyl-accepting chemotaxis protein [Aquabacterium sp.]|uniref:methyl-accepting chemotaxis protein n=1 Tax=Aquabacterium sp. TaxID=1872578 RepID=UPI002E357B4D|nr:methyl-accepting chemotaxis protein [Aquabacterium sp.]HEX5310371.1 methyl-accepting chemotaxis protein [Aquabacterium sp.]
MHWLADLRLRTKLISAISVVLAMTLFLGIFANSRLSSVHERTQDLADNWMPSVVVLGEINNVTSDLQRFTLRHILATDAGAKRALEQDIQKAQDAFSKADQDYAVLIASPEEKATWDDLKKKWADYLNIQAQVMAASQGGNVQQATELVNGKLSSAFLQVSADLDALIALNVKGGKDSERQSEQTYNTARWAVWSSLALVVAVGMAIAVVLSGMMSKPMEEAVAVLKAVAEGDLTQQVHSQRRDEIGDMQRAIGQMVKSLADTVNQVRSGADSVATASSQIAQGNTDLSARTEDQASSLQETAAAVEEMAGTVRTNADNARQANQLASAASEVAARGGEVVGQVVDTMNDIQTASQKISDIIGVIDGIAFQTNILALNAAVEAARAGEQGRGFAVVAGEVRSLAQRSAQAAREIKTLINDSVEKVNAGSSLVSTAGSTMQDVVHQVRKVTDLVGEIAHASAEQSQGIGQINQAVAQLDQSTQQNAALVEESMAAAESLRSQANKLAQAVTVFRTLEGSPSLVAETATVVTRKPFVNRERPVTVPKPAMAKPSAPELPAPVRTAEPAGHNEHDWETF